MRVRLFGYINRAKNEPMVICKKGVVMACVIISAALDRDLRVEFLNKNLGASDKADVVGRHLSEVIRPENFGFVSAAFEQSRETGESSRLSYAFPDPRGNMRVFVDVSWLGDGYIVSGYGRID